MAAVNGEKRTLSTASQAERNLQPHTTWTTSKYVKNSDEDDPASLEPSASITDLPKELIIQIISCVLIHPHPTTLRKPQEYRWAKELDSLRPKPFPDMKRRRTRRSPLLNILLVCRDFYFAGLETYYSFNTFHFDTPLHFRDTFVNTLTDRHKACVKHLVIDWVWQNVSQRPVSAERKWIPEWPWPLEGDLLRSFPALESVTVCLFMRQQPIFLAAASRAKEARAQIVEMVEEAWPSGKGKLDYLLPPTWGRLKDM